MSETIRIDDLGNPRLNDMQQSIVDFGRTLEVALDAQDILQEAQQGLGLTDFGPRDFLPRLELLCDEWGSDAGLNNLGRMNLRANLGATFRDDTYTHPNLMPDGIQESFVKWDARIELADDNAGWSVALLGKNLSNEKVFTQSFLTPVLAGNVTRLVDVRRTIALEASYRIGG